MPFAAILVLFSLAFGGRLLFIVPEVGSIPLPGGGRQVIRAITIGKVHHPPRSETPCGQLLRWATRAPAPATGSNYLETTPGKSIQFWLDLDPGSPYLQPLARYYQLEDEHGCYFGFSIQGGIRAMFHPGPFTYEEVFKRPVGFESFPRRGKSLRLVLLDDDLRTLLPHEVANPQSDLYPHWVAPHPPVSASDGDLSVTLGSLTPNGGRMKANFQFEQHGRTTKGWLPVRAEATDATGNRGGGFGLPKNERGSILLDGLCREESAWRLKVHCARTIPGTAVAEETVELPSLPRCRLGATANRILKGRRGPFWFGECKVSRPRATPDRWIVEVEILTDKNAWTLFPRWRGTARSPGIEAWLEWGNTARPALVGEQGWGRYVFEMPSPKASRPPVLVLDAFRERTVEFLVKP